MQKRSKVIIDLINNNINVEQALEILDLLLQNVKNNKIKKWLSNEINGYDKNDDLPDYRIVSTNLKGSYIIGSAFNGIKGTNQPLPLKPEYIKDYSNIKNNRVEYIINDENKSLTNQLLTLLTKSL